MLTHFISNLRIFLHLILAVSVYGQAQSFEAEHLELKQKKFRHLIRSYQDSLADVDYLLATLQEGDNQESDYYLAKNKPSVIGSEEVPIQKNQKHENEQHSTTKYTPFVKVSTEGERIIAPQSTKNNALTSKFAGSNNGNSRQQKKPRVEKNYGTKRVGAICRDGTRSYATGRGACSHHGGVSHWLVE